MSKQPENYISKHLRDFFKEVSYLNGSLYVVNSLLTSRTEQLERDFPHPQNLWSSITVFRDLSLLTDDDNLYDTGYGHNITSNDLKQNLDKSISYVCCSTISHIYEVFDSFVKSTLASIYMHCDTSERKHFKFKTTITTYDEARRELGREQSLLKIVRRLSTFYKIHEKLNIWNLDVGIWYKMIEQTRHQIVHNRQKFSYKFWQDFKLREDGILFANDFTLLDNGDSYNIMLDYRQADKIIQTFMELAHLVFKGLSINLSLHTDYSR